MDGLSCSSHPDRPAIGECADRGKALCEACVHKETRRDGPVCSRECYMRFVSRGAGGPPSSRRIAPLRAANLAIKAGMLILLLFLAGDEIMAVAHWVMDRLGLPGGPGR